MPSGQPVLLRRRPVLLSMIASFAGLFVAELNPKAMPAASAGTNTYPSKWANAPMDSILDSWGEWNRECTSYAAWMLHSENGFEMPFHDNAVNWGPDARNLGHTVNSTPAVGAIYWTTSPQHVAWVESVNPGGTVTIEEYNHDYTGHWSERTVATGSASGYIHFKDIQKYHYQPFVADFNGDGIADIGLRDADNGTFYIKHGPSFNDQITYRWAPGTHYQAFAGDFNGDGIADIGLRDADNGTFYIKHGPSFNDQITYRWAPGTNYQAFAGDF